MGVFYKVTPKNINLVFGPPVEGRVSTADLLLELQHSVKKSLGSGRATGDVDVDRDNPIASTDYSVRVVVVSTTVGAGSHGNNPAGLSHLVVNFTEGGSHLVGQSTGNDHDIGLTGTGTENDTKTVEIVTTGTTVHHFYGTAGKTESHGPHGSSTGPVDEFIGRGNNEFGSVIQLADLGGCGVRFDGGSGVKLAGNGSNSGGAALQGSPQAPS